MEKSKRNSWIICLTVTALSFILLFIGIYYVLGNHITIQNIAVYAILSLIFGCASSVLYRLNLRIMCGVYLLGLTVGFFEMISAFFDNRDGWGDLVGLISLFTWMIFGLCTGAVLQLIRYLYRRLRSHGQD